MKALIKRFLKEEDGVTAIEYGLIAGLVAIALITGLTQLSGGLNGLFNQVATQVCGTGCTNTNAGKS
ncbi:Flp family type IVb pilin [Burkholderia sp. Bp9017]|uniref:Flp family type IVb pilin n=1 Tax=Burkholderia anthina TaxID=179879 RepID=A0A7T7AIW9_9BURK|nr:MULTISPECIES: Flp family type IVb pilin [Burkholderia]QQK04032.1 Flp family type IVb pilin [Burkholderia anthina]RQZ29579.1 Flp family type IVb pilin [Burkholderia sp. Bp9017]RQZ37174.1 Flp family type IVb pilin [Burkholderia sp. Bp9016]